MRRKPSFPLAIPCAVTLLSIAAILSLGGCTTEGPAGPPGAPGEPANLQDPAIIPTVVSTSPAEHSTGPYGLFSPGEGQYNPNFVLQFNKLINTNVLTPTTVRVGGFNRPVRVVLYRDPIRIVLDKTTNGPFDNILAFNIYDSIYVYYPHSIYGIGTTYTVTVDSSITDINGNHMARPYTFSFTPEPYFRVTTFYPHNQATDVQPGASISITFNSIVDTSVFRYLHITPTPRGQWWMSSYDSTSVAYVYDRPLPFDSTFTVSVDAGAPDAHGNLTTTSQSSSFTTIAFRVTDTYPDPGTMNFPPASQINMLFSGLLDTASVRAAFGINPPTAGILYASSSYLSFSPMLGFAPATQYTVTLSTALKASDGTSLASPYSFSFTTDQFRVSSTYPSNGDFNVYRGQSVVIYFNSFIDTASARSAFSISPPLSGVFSSYGGDIYQPGRIIFDHTTQFLANTTYTVTISTALTDARGNHFPAAFSFSFTTGTN